MVKVYILECASVSIMNIMSISPKNLQIEND